MATTNASPASPVNNGGKTLSLAELLAKPVKDEPIVLWIFGNEGQGKTTLAAQFEKPIFIATEKGMRNFKHLPALYPKTWIEFKSMVRLVVTDPHDRKTLVIDTADWAEAMAVEYVCARDDGTMNDRGKPIKTMRDGKPMLDGYSWGGGGKMIQSEWRNLIPYLDAVRDRRGMQIVILSHAGSQKVTQEEMEADSTIIAPSVNKLTTDLFSQYVDATLYLTSDQVTVKEGDERTRAKVSSTGKRILITQHRGAVRAKNRFSLPYKMELSYTDLMRRIRENTPENAEPLKAEMLAVLGKLTPGPKVDAARSWLLDASGNNLDAIKDQLEKVKAQLAEQAATASAPAT